MAYGAQAVDNPDVFKGLADQRIDPFPFIIVGVTGYGVSSHGPASAVFHPINLDQPLALANIYVVKSINASVPGATNASSTGSEGYTYAHSISVFRRQDYAANSSNLVFVASASGGLTAAMNYAGTGVGGASQTYAMSWLTDTTGGKATFSTTSGAGNWSSYATGVKRFQIPFNTFLSAGEYFFAHQHSSTAATSGSNVVLLSVSNFQIQPTALTFGVLGSSQASLSGVGAGIASAVTTNDSMASSVISANANQWVQYFSNA
jgi:hypothetical protein